MCAHRQGSCGFCARDYFKVFPFREIFYGAVKSLPEKEDPTDTRLLTAIFTMGQVESREFAKYVIHAADTLDSLGKVRSQRPSII